MMPLQVLKGHCVRVVARCTPARRGTMLPVAPRRLGCQLDLRLYVVHKYLI